MNKIFLKRNPDKIETTCEKEKRLVSTAERALRRNELINSLGEVVSTMRAASGSSNAPLRPMSTHAVTLFGIVRDDGDGRHTKLLAQIPDGCIYEISDDANTVCTIIPVSQREWFADFCADKGWKARMVSGRISLR